MKKRGFTLIELIAVIAILAVLAIVAVPRVIVYVDKSKKVALIEDSRVIYDMAEAAYNDGSLTDKNGVCLVNDNKNKDFGSIPVTDAIDSLERDTTIVKNDEELKKITDYRDDYKENMARLRDLQTLLNTPVDKISIDSKGNLQGKFKSDDNKTSIYIADNKIHRAIY